MEKFMTKMDDDDLPTIEADRLERLSNEFAEKMMEGVDTKRHSPESMEDFRKRIMRSFNKYMTARYIIVPSKSEPKP